MQDSKNLLKEYLISIKFILCFYNRPTHLPRIQLLIYSKHFYWLSSMDQNHVIYSQHLLTIMLEPPNLAHAHWPCDIRMSNGLADSLMSHFSSPSWLKFAVSKH